MRLMIYCLVPFLNCCGLDSESDVKLIGGKVVEIPQVVELSMGCTGTVVGPHVIITAGHCVTENSKASYNYKGVTYVATFARNPEYKSNATNDQAFGVTKEVMPEPYASIDTKPVVVGETVELMGYGCTNVGWFGGASGYDHKLRAGFVPVTKISSLEYMTVGRSQLCYGDSGGPVVRDRSQVLKIVGVNSKRQTNNKTTSYLARVDYPQFVEFAKTLVAAQLVEICGISSDCSGL